MWLLFHLLLLCQNSSECNFWERLVKSPLIDVFATLSNIGDVTFWESFQQMKWPNLPLKSLTARFSNMSTKSSLIAITNKIDFNETWGNKNSLPSNTFSRVARPDQLIVSIYEIFWKRFVFLDNPAGIYMFKVNNRNTKTRCRICSKLTIKAPERPQPSFWCLYC